MYNLALERISGIGGRCLQIFSTSPRGWNFAKIDDVEIAAFLTRKKELGIDPIYFHASYLINLADKGRIGSLSKLSLISELNISSKLHIKGTIVHLGSFKDYLIDDLHKDKPIENRYATLIKQIKEILEKTPNNTLFIVENAGNNKIGKDLDEIATVIKQVDDPRIRVCIDTCHLSSAGYDLSNPGKIDQFLETFDVMIGLERLEVIHINDSRDPFNSGRDRHENIGVGTIGIQTFRLILNHPKLKHLPFIIETPGFDKNGPDKKNLDILKSLIA